MTYFDKPRIGKTTAIISFVVGTVLLGLYYFTYNSTVLLVGYIFVILIIIANIAVFIASLVEAFNNKVLRKKLLMNGALMLINIPIAICYIWLVMFLLNTYRITLINPNNTELTDLKLNGCEEKFIDSIEPGKSKTIWISINNDCSINLQFKLKNEMKNEIITGYTTSMGGQKIDHIIGKGNQEI